ncbi:MAG TPA: peptidoglycan DD-metalloendopeptidase family protein [Mycobacteriales bacterium]|nr:peptidoglycan DD-metalloendopeptidase family protein [Mycobacteriales bacterium]
MSRPSTHRRASLRRAASATAVLVASLVLAQGVPGAASAEPAGITQAKQDAAQLRTELADLQRRSAQAIVALEEAERELGTAVARSTTLGHELEAARAAAGGSDRQLQRRVSALYRAGGTLGVWASLLEARDPADFAARKANVDTVVATDAELRDRAVDGAGRVAALEEQAREATAATVRATGVAEARAAEIGDLLERQRVAIDRADDRVRALVEAERRAQAQRELEQLLAEMEAQQRARAAARAAAAAAGTSGLTPGAGSDPAESNDPYVGPAGACPVGPVHSFTDTWNAPRSGGRKHQGTDVFAPYGAPAYAVVDGVVDKWGSGGLGGISLWIRGDNGDRYYYAHNVSNVAEVGERVTAGQLVAYVGTTGNAATTPPHIHFEAHPAGGSARNPYPWLRALCG